MQKIIKHYILSKEDREKEHELGMYILNRGKAFSHDMGCQPEASAFSAIENFIKTPKHLATIDQTHQYLQTVFMADYEQNLYEFYRQQQYLILLTFLSYPFRGPGGVKLTPFIRGSEKLKKMRILDYGSGLSFGIIHLLRTNPSIMDAITIVDFDLIHTKFLEYIISTSAPTKDFKVFKLRDTEQIPDFRDRKFNFLYGNNIFEHVHHPEHLLRSLLEKAEKNCICYFDFSDHGQRHLQHVHPDLSNLEKIMIDFSFYRSGYFQNMLEFTRNLE